MLANVMQRFGQTSSRFCTSGLSLSRSMTTKNESEFFTVEVNEPKETAILTMKSSPANSFTLPFLTDYLIQWDRLENARNIRTVIITSAQKGIFSAGIDLSELNNPKGERLREFYKNFQALWIKMYGSSKITIAAVNGRAVAAGCVFAMCCDYRIALPMQKAFGIAAGRIGLITPPFVIDTLIHSVGTRKAELMLQSAHSYSSAEAQQMGIIDEIADTPEKIMIRAHEVAAEWMKSPSHSHEIIKMSFRKPAIDRFMTQREEEAETFCSHVLRDSIQKTIRQFTDVTKKGKPKDSTASSNGSGTAAATK